MTHTHATAPTQFIEANGISFAYRSFGAAAGVPLVFLQHFTGTMDGWDPSVVDGFARERPVILFDNAGVSSSGGATPDNVHAMADHVVAFITALERQARRTDGGDPASSGETITAQLHAIVQWGGSPGPDAATRLQHIAQPVLVVNGKSDIMVPTVNSYALFQKLPDARLILYPDSGHGALFQYSDAFVRAGCSSSAVTHDRRPIPRRSTASASSLRFPPARTMMRSRSSGSSIARSCCDGHLSPVPHRSRN